METDTFVVLCLAGLYVLWIVVPLVPAVLIYRLFPDVRVGIGGPLGNLTMKASGAFAAYVITFLIGLPFALKSHETVGGFTQPVWTVSAEILAFDHNGQRVQSPTLLKTLSITLTPDISVISDGKVTVSVPGVSKKWPYISVQLPNFGGTTIDINRLDSDSLEIDRFSKVVTILEPIRINQFISAGADLGASK